ncbi:unnamed protein product, partial [Owenia fusiformis]
ESKMSAPRQNCLIVLSSAKEGVSAASFIQAFTLTHTTFTVQLATPGGKAVDYVNQDDNSRRWLNDFRTKAFSMPISLDAIEPNRYSALLIPCAPGAISDLANSPQLAIIINNFVAEKKPICAIGLGVSALCCARKDGGDWSLKDYSLTSTSVFELARSVDFANLQIIPEDFIKDNGGTYSCSKPDCVHVVIDQHIITGQNEQSTLTSVQNLILLCNQRQGKK